MKIILIFALISLTLAQNSNNTSENAFNDWHQFQLKFNKTYNSIAEEYKRRKIYQDNLQYIKNHNQQAARGRFTFRLSMNQLGDLASSFFLIQNF